MRRFLAVVLLFLPLSSYAWWNNDWNYRKEITFDLTPAAADIANTPNDVPILIRLSLGNFGYFADTKPDGSDLRFVASDDKTPLKFHVERYDVTNQMAFVWVNVPRMAGATSNDKVYLYYGNTKASAGPKASESYDVNEVLVLHFGEGDAALTDSTAYANKPSVSTAEINPASLIGGGAKFDGNKVITVPSSSSLRLIPAKGATVSAWVRIEQPQTDAYVMALEEQGKRFVLGIKGVQVYTRVTVPGGEAEISQTDSLTTAAWHHLAATVGGGKLTLYIDGKPAYNGAPAVPLEVAGVLSIGNSAAGNNGLVGEVDEVQMSSVARPVEWLRAAAKSQGQDAPLVIYGGDAQREGEKVNYFATTMRNVTPDGWVVIIILTIMFVIAVMIMIGKALYLARIRRANTVFIKEFERLRGDPAALDDKDDVDGDDALSESAFMPKMKGDHENKFKYSTIYRLYHHGVHEMNGRVGSSVGARAVKTLNPQAIAAIHAAMDATLVRTTQKMQSRMVLLTIAIAGGPFLGLLGTVVGVMITFAAIAASGDVNVNSIAPGIAAALAATVAGLAVAIPALFGYNWLNTQIKEITADMRVFVDEFVTRVAEQYS
ncbi:MAG TPA: DUF2341 domain-containing protein [Steroidobacteraceae bacterium]|nr:DUF2341 domain-containing protein [Steroidobacteraceae bacterium]